MADELLVIADAVVFELNQSGRWSVPFVAERKYLPETEFENFLAGQMHVTVLARGRNRTSASRGSSQVEYAIPVLFQQKLAANTDAAIAPSIEDQCDALMTFVQEVADWFDVGQGVPLTQYETAKFLASSNDPAYDQASLEENMLFTSVLVLGFRTWRAKR